MKSNQMMHTKCTKKCKKKEVQNGLGLDLSFFKSEMQFICINATSTTTARRIANNGCDALLMCVNLYFVSTFRLVYLHLTLYHLRPSADGLHLNRNSNEMVIYFFSG